MQNDADWAKHHMIVDVDRIGERGCPRKTWWNDFKEDTDWYEKF